MSTGKTSFARCFQARLGEKLLLLRGKRCQLDERLPPHARVKHRRRHAAKGKLLFPLGDSLRCLFRPLMRCLLCVCVCAHARARLNVLEDSSRTHTYQEKKKEESGAGVGGKDRLSETSITSPPKSDSAVCRSSPGPPPARCCAYICIYTCIYIYLYLYLYIYI